MEKNKPGSRTSGYGKAAEFIYSGSFTTRKPGSRFSRSGEAAYSKKLENSLPGKLPKVIVIVGPTASGKTALSLEIAKRFNGEIVSADSRQIYRDMDIGTAKPAQVFGQAPSAQKFRGPKTWVGKAAPPENIFYSDGIRHYLINIRNPNQDYSVGQYKKDALAAIRKIIKDGKLPIIVGGTGLYVDAVVKNLDIPEVKENKKLRAKLEKEIKTKGLNFVFKRLIELDPEAAYIVDPQNPRRVIRAMEVALATGKPFTPTPERPPPEFGDKATSGRLVWGFTAQRKTGPPLFDFLQIGLKLSPEKLKEKIQKRTAKMIKERLVKEVKNLVKKYGPDLLKTNRGSSIVADNRDYTPKAFDAIGYREVIEYLKNKITLAEAEDLINKNTWHYAKRQTSWFKRNTAIRWFDATQKQTSNQILKTVSKFLGFS